MSKEERVSAIATCSICMLAQAMKVCPLCKFNLSVKVEDVVAQVAS